MTFPERLAQVESAIASAAGKTGRARKDITFVAVTKGAPADAVRRAREAGLVLFGENKVQEAAAKIPEAGVPDAVWHMIGHLQTNKAKDAVALFQMIQSVDSVRIGKAISDAAAAAGKTMDVLLEVNISGEAQKYGFAPEALYGAIEEISSLPSLRILGLMGMAPLAADADAKRAAFAKLKKLFGVCKSMKKENLEMRHLSMGMSDDFGIAIEEGSNMIRLGRALFA